MFKHRVGVLMFVAAALLVSGGVQGATLRGNSPEDSPKQASQAAMENAVRGELAKKGGHLHSVLLTRSPGTLVPVGLKLRHGHLADGKGLEVEKVEPAGAAADAGVIMGDIITDPGEDVFQKKEFDAASSGHAMPLTVLRNATTIDHLVLHPKVNIEDFGLSLIRTEHASRGNTCTVFKIIDVEPGSIAGRAEPRLSKDDILVGVNGISISEQPKEAMRHFDTAGRVLLSVFNADEFECPVLPNEVSKEPKHILADEDLPPSAKLTKLLVDANASHVLSHMDVVSNEIRKMHGPGRGHCHNCTRSILRYIRKAINTEKEAEALRAPAPASIPAPFERPFARPESMPPAPASVPALASALASAPSPSPSPLPPASTPSPVVHHHDLPKEGVSLDCVKIKEICGESYPHETNLVCGSDGKTYHRPCLLHYHSCKQMKAAAAAGKNPLNAAIDVLRKGHCASCREVTLGKDSLLFDSNFGISFEPYTSAEGYSFPRIRSVRPGSVAAASMLVHPGEILFTVGSRNTCSAWDPKRISRKFRGAEVLKFSVCSEKAALKAAPSVCPKPTLPSCRRVLIHDAALSSDGISFGSRSGKCGAFPTITSHVWEPHGSTVLIPQGSILFSIDGNVQCNKGPGGVREAARDATGRSFVVEICPSEAVDSDYVCGNVCQNANIAIEEEQKQEQEEQAQKQDEQEQEEQETANGEAVEKKTVQNRKALVTQVNTDMADLIAPACRRIEIQKTSVKYGLEIKETNDGMARNITVSRVHKGRGLDDVDILAGDQISMVDGVPVDNFDDLSSLEARMKELDAVEIWIHRDSLPHDVMRTLVRDPLGFGMSFASTQALASCGLVMPTVASLDVLMHGLHNTDTGTDLLYTGDIVTRHGSALLCGETPKSMTRRVHAENTSVQLELCPGGSENLRLYEATLCRLCKPQPATLPEPKALPVEEEEAEEVPEEPKEPEEPEELKEENEEKEEQKEEAEEEEKEKKGVTTATAVAANNSNATGARVSKPTTPEELCLESGRKWCGYAPKTEFETPENEDDFDCVGILEMCPVRFPPINPQELVKYCNGPNGNDPRLCSRAGGNLTLPPLPEPDVEEEKPIAPTPPPMQLKPKLEKKGQVCRKGGFCPYGDCPDLYEKTIEKYCAPGPEAPRPVPTDPHHICVPGQWCPPGYACPPGFELKTAGEDGFCFDKTRQGPMVEPEFVGANFVGL